MFEPIEIGVDLGSYEIKIVQVNQVNNKDSQLNRLNKFASYPVTCEPYSEEYFKFLKKSLRNFSKIVKKKSFSINFSLPINNFTNVLFMNVPVVNKKDLNEGIKFEANQTLALKDIKKAQFTWKIANTYEELNEHEILLATITENIVKHLVNFKSIRCKVNRIMLQPVLLERFTKGNDVILDFGHSHVRIYMYKEGRLTNVDMINTGGSLILNELKDFIISRGINEYTIDDLLNNINISTLFTSELEQIFISASNVVKKPIMQMFDELKRIIRSFELQNGIDIDNVYYIGELTNLKYFTETLESELDLNISPLIMINKEIEEIKYELASLAAMDPKLQDYTNFSKTIKKNVDHISLLIAILTVSLSTGMSLKIINERYDLIIDKLTQQTNQQQITLEGLQGDITSAQNSIDKSEAFINKIEQIKNEKKWLSDILYVIPDLTPISIVIKDINIIDKKVEIEGYGADYSAIGFFSSELEKVGKVNLNTIVDYEYEDGEMFSVTLKNPDKISNKFLMTKNFTLTLDFQNALLEH